MDDGTMFCVLVGRQGRRLLQYRISSFIISNMMQSISSQPKRPGTIFSGTAVLLLFTIVVVPSSAIRTITSFATSSSSSITLRTTRLSPYACHESNIAQYIPAINLEVLKVRGGSDDLEDDDDDAELDDVEDVFDEFELGDEADEDDFAENSFLDRAIDAYHKTPPLTKGYLTASAIITGLGWAMNRNQFPEIFLLDWKQTLTKGQIWRPITTFFNFGPLGLGYLLTVHFVWTYMSTLERLHHRKPYEFWIMISFGMMSMVFGYPILKLNARFLGHNLSTFLVYMWSRYHEGMQVKMFEVHTTRAEMLPWYFLLQVSIIVVVGGCRGCSLMDGGDGVSHTIGPFFPFL
jgi:Derlin-2/3